MTNTMVIANEKTEVKKELVQEEVSMNQEVQTVQQGELQSVLEEMKKNEEQEKKERLNKLTDEILIKKKDFNEKSLTAVVDLGKDLNTAKGLAKQGEWSEWLSERVKFTQRTATTYMNIAREFSDVEKQKSIANLGITKIGMLAELDEIKRDEVMKLPDIQSMSTRDLRKQVDKLKKKPGEAGRSDSVSKSIKKRVNILKNYVNENSIIANDNLSEEDKTYIRESITNLEAIIASMKRSLEAVPKAA